MHLVPLDTVRHNCSIGLWADMLYAAVRLSKSFKTTLFQSNETKKKEKKNVLLSRWTEVMRHSCTSQKYFEIWLLLCWHAAYESSMCKLGATKMQLLFYQLRTKCIILSFCLSSFGCSFRKIYVLQRLRQVVPIR